MHPSVKRLQRAFTMLAGCGLLLLLPACRLPCLQHAEPGAPLPVDFNGVTSDQNSAELGVNEFFQDPLLTSLVAQAMSGNQELKILEQEIELAANDIILRR